MGLDWGFCLKNKEEKDFNIYLISFCGWNSETILDRSDLFDTYLKHTNYYLELNFSC